MKGNYNLLSVASELIITLLLFSEALFLAMVRDGKQAEELVSKKKKNTKYEYMY
jgi:hypothetical protein